MRKYWSEVLEKELRPCPCGGKGRYRYRMPCHWIECKKCGLRTGYYTDWTEQNDPAAKNEAVKAWNDRKVQHWEKK